MRAREYSTFGNTASTNVQMHDNVIWFLPVCVYLSRCVAVYIPLAQNSFYPNTIYEKSNNVLILTVFSIFSSLLSFYLQVRDALLFIIQMIPSGKKQNPTEREKNFCADNV